MLYILKYDEPKGCIYEIAKVSLTIFNIIMKVKYMLDHEKLPHFTYVQSRCLISHYSR